MQRLDLQAVLLLLAQLLLQLRVLRQPVDQEVQVLLHMPEVLRDKMVFRELSQGLLVLCIQLLT
jgi:hypothetical protein